MMMLLLLLLLLLMNISSIITAHNQRPLRRASTIVCFDIPHPRKDPRLKSELAKIGLFSSSALLHTIATSSQYRR
jgi:hypothetical protein